MGLFKKLKKGLKVIKPLLKVAAKTAPIWTNFIPVGGSFVNTAVQKFAPLLDKGKALRNKIRTAGGVGSILAGMGGGPRAGPSTGLNPVTAAGGRLGALLGGPRHRMQAERSAAEEGAFEGQGVVHAGIRGPVAQRYGPIHSHLRAARSGFMSRRTTRKRPTAYRARRRGGRFVSRSRRRRRAA